MKGKKSSKVLAGVLSLLMLSSAVPLSAYAAIDNYDKNFESETHTVFKHTEQTLAPGVTNYTNYAYSKDGKQMVYYVTTADLNRDDVVAQVAYKDMQNEVYGMEKLANMVSCANAKYSNPEDSQYISDYYKVVSACNGDGYNMTTGEPSGVFIMGGNVKKDWNKNSNPAFLAILNDGSAVIDKTQEAWNACKEAGISEAIDVFSNAILVWDGVDTTANISGSYNVDRQCRTVVGVTEDGKLVICSVDGRQEPFSCGASTHELAQIMLEAGCVRAFNLDGGGSTTFMAKNEGTDDCVIINRPSDGSERAISNGIIIASTAKPSNVFERAILSADNEYITSNATATITTKGVSSAGTYAKVPDDAYLTLEDPSFGTIDGNTFTPAKTGDAVIQMVYNGAVVGQTTVHVVVPDAISFDVAALAVPYGKSSDISLTLTYGELKYNVKFDLDDVDIAISDSKYGIIDGFVFNATSDNTVTEEGTMSATITGTDISAEIPLQLGKGSEVLFDFEDASTSDWGSFDYYNANVDTQIKPVDSTKGKVHSGNYAMQYSIDFSQLTYYEDYIASTMTYNAEKIKNHGLTTDPDGVSMYGTLDDYVDITGATGLGFWVYIPDEIDVAGLNPRFTFGYKKTATSAWTRGASDMNNFLIERDGFGSDGWYYFYVDLSAFSNYYALTLQNNRLNNASNKNGYKNERYYGSVVEWYVEDRAWKYNQSKSYTSQISLYIDDITVDYSSVVEDREPPVFGTVSYATTGMSDASALNNNATLANSNIDFAASVAENTTKSNSTGINANSAKAYIDGNEVTATYTNGKITVDNTANFADGVHTVKFEISDNQGNTSHIVRTFTVSSGSSANTIKVVPKNTELTSTLVGSLYYIDVVATDISSVDSVSLTLKVNNVNDWEPNGIISSDGFTATYVKDESDKGLITLNITRTGDITATGEAVLASIPIRTWYPHNALGKNSNWIITQKKCVYPMDIQMLTKAGNVSFTDGTTGTFSAEKIQIDSEAMCAVGYIGVNKGNEGGKNTVTSWHEHTAVAIDDKAATCTESGYTGRTYCEVCDSVVDWGTTIPATDHTYEIIDDVLKCKDCGKLFNGEYEGKLYADGVLVNDWVDNSYYADGVKVTGIYNVDGYYYDFGDDGVCEDKAKYNGLLTEDGSLYYIALGVKTSGWFKVDENDYYFDATTLKAVDGVQKIDGHTYKFVDCVLMEGSLERTTSNNLTLYWAGRTYYNAWLNAQGKTYHFDAYGHLARGLCVLSVSTGGDKFAFVFNEDTGILERQITGNGLINDEKGTVYLVDDVAQYAGLVKEGSDYYYINSYCTAVTGRYWVAKTNGLLSGGYYDFAEDGKMINPPADKKDGISFESDGTYYYVDGVRTYAGLVKHGDDYYYFNSGLKAVTGTYWVAKTNDLLPGGNYKFDETGKMLQGLVEENGGTYYYVNGKLNNAGLIKVGDDYYYINSSCKAVTGTYWVNTTNGLMPAGYYNFDTNGVMLDAPVEKKDGISFESDGTYYYVDGVRTYAGLVKEGNDYYYFNSGLKAVTGTYWVAKTNDLLPGGSYKFDETGKMLQGLVEENGGTYYYVNGKLNNAGLIEVDGNYYYINSSCKAVTGKYWVNTTNGLMPAGYYNFDTNGKMILN